MSESLTRDEVLEAIRRAREKGERLDLRWQALQGTNLRSADLWGTNLHSADLRVANLRDANLRDADLRDADLRVANLRDANLRDANLRDANLRFAKLRGANLRGTDLGGADLWVADLRGADLRGTDLSGANLREARWGGLQITELPSGQLILTPTSDGWWLQVGCWSGTPDELRDLIAQDEGWPEAKGKEITRRRPYLQAALALCEVHMADHSHVIDDLKEKWGE